MDKYEKIAVALLFAILIVWVWRSIPNSPKVYPGGRRLHHGLIGAVLVVVGLLSKKSYIMAFGAILAVDDIEIFHIGLTLSNAVIPTNYTLFDTIHCIDRKI